MKINNLDQDLKDMCSSFRNIMGNTFASIMYICVNKNEELGAEIALDWTEFLILRQIYYLYEFELGGLATSSDSGATRARMEGPVWFQEGMAMAYANSQVTNATHAQYREVMRKKLDGKSVDYSQLERRSALRDNSLTVNRAGAVAATYLLEAHGTKKIGEYLARLPESSSWQEVFLKTFGISVDDFNKTLN